MSVCALSEVMCGKQVPISTPDHVQYACPLVPHLTTHARVAQDSFRAELSAHLTIHVQISFTYLVSALRQIDWGN